MKRSKVSLIDDKTGRTGAEFIFTDEEDSPYPLGIYVIDGARFLSIPEAKKLYAFLEKELAKRS